MTQNGTTELRAVLLTLAEQGRSQTWLARVLDLSLEHTNRVLQGKLPATPEFRAKVARALGVPEPMLFPPAEQQPAEVA